MIALDPRGSSRVEVVSVTLRQERLQAEVTPVRAARHTFEWVLGGAGVLLAAVGVYVFYAPPNWFLAGRVDSWYLGVFVGADILLAAAFGVFARRAYLVDRTWTDKVVFGTGLMVLELAGAVTCAVIGIL